MTQSKARVKARPWAVIIGITVVGAAALTLALFTLFGFRAFMIETPSMATTAPVGSLVVTHAQPHYSQGEIISFTENGRTVTHRIIGYAGADSTPKTGAGFTTKGDLNGSPDAWTVSPSSIIGKAVWIAPGLGWLWKGLPWLLLGVVLTELLARAPFIKQRWRWNVRLIGWSLTFALVVLWLRPWFNVVNLDSRAADGGDGILMHVVNTGLFPLAAGAATISSGQDAIVHVTEQLPNGKYFLLPKPDLPLPLQIFIVICCLIPFVAAVLLRRSLMKSDAAVEAGAAVAVSARRSRAVTLIVVAVLTVIAVVAVLAFSSSKAAFAAKITNSSDISGTRTFFTCSQAETSTSNSPYAAYAMGTSGVSRETDLTGNGRNGTWMQTATSASDFGCQRDTPKASVNFSNSSNQNQCLYVPGQFSSPNTFSLEAWFKTSKTANGRIIGFSSDAQGVNDPYNDREVYVDTNGRIVFGIYPNQVVVVAANDKSYADNNWHQVVATLSSAGMYLYVDGKLASSNTNATAAQAFNGYWKIGCGRMDAWVNADGSYYNGPRYFTGNIQYAAIYNVALTADAVKAHYLAGAP